MPLPEATAAQESRSSCKEVTWGREGEQCMEHEQRTLEEMEDACFQGPGLMQEHHFKARSVHTTVKVEKQWVKGREFRHPSRLNRGVLQIH